MIANNDLRVLESSQTVAQKGQTLSCIVIPSKHHAGTNTQLSYGNITDGVMLMDTQGAVLVGSSYVLICWTGVVTIEATEAGMHLRAPGCGCCESAGFAGVLGFAGGFCCARGGLRLAGGGCVGCAGAGFVGALGFAWAGRILEGGAWTDLETGGFLSVVGTFGFAWVGVCFAGGTFEVSSDRTEADSCSMQLTILPLNAILAHISSVSASNS